MYSVPVLFSWNEYKAVLTPLKSRVYLIHCRVLLNRGTDCCIRVRHLKAVICTQDIVSHDINIIPRKRELMLMQRTWLRLFFFNSKKQKDAIRVMPAPDTRTWYVVCLCYVVPGVYLFIHIVVPGVWYDTICTLYVRVAERHTEYHFFFFFCIPTYIV